MYYLPIFAMVFSIHKRRFGVITSAKKHWKKHPNQRAYYPREIMDLVELQNLYITGISVMAICCTITMIFVSITIYQLYCKSVAVFISNHSKLLTVITMITYTLCSLGDMAHMILRFINHLTTTSHNYPYLVTIKSGFYYVGNGAFFMLLLMRIKKSFQLSKCIMYYLSLLWILSVTCSMGFLIITFVAALDESSMNDDIYYQTSLYFVVVADFILSFSLFVLFIYKIKYKESMEGLEVADDVSLISGASNDNLEIKDKRAVLNVMIKHCVLFGIALVINEAFYVILFIWNFDKLFQNYSADILLGYTGRTIENVFNVIILWLLIKINNDKYVFLCKCWHICILRYCIKDKSNVYGEGFEDEIDDEKVISMQKPKLSFNKSEDKIEGHDLMVTDNDIKNKYFEGRDVLLTEPKHALYHSIHHE